MIEQPTRVKRCQSCRIKRKKCDLQRPTCGRCVQTRNTCTWDRPKMRMVSFESSSAGGQALGVNTPAGGEARLRTKVIPSYRSALWMQFQARFLGSTPGWLGHAFGWVSAMEGMRERTPATKMATTALPLILVGQQQGDTQLLQDGLHMYSGAMGLLAREVQAHAQTQQGQNQVVQKQKLTPRQAANSLLTCLAMLNIEMMYSEGICQYSWLTHVTGIASMLAAAGPRMFQDELHSVFLYCRTTVAIIALCIEVPVFLANEAWMTVPFVHVKRDTHTRLFDIMVHLPLLLHQASVFAVLEQDETGHDADQQHCQHKLVRRYTQIQKQLKAWRDSLDSSWTSSRMKQQLGDASWPGYAYTFATTGQANVWITYWMAQIALYKVALRASSSSTSPSPSSLSSSPSSESSSESTALWFALQVEIQQQHALRAANNICASGAYLAADHRGAMSVMFYTMPMRAALELYRTLGMEVEAQLALGISRRTMQAGLAVTQAVEQDAPHDSSGYDMFAKVVG